MFLRSGLYFAVYALSLLHNGVFELHNYLRTVVHSPGIVMLGILLMILAVIPDSVIEWIVETARSEPMTELVSLVSFANGIAR